MIEDWYFIEITTLCQEEGEIYTFPCGGPGDGNPGRFWVVSCWSWQTQRNKCCRSGRKKRLGMKKVIIYFRWPGRKAKPRLWGQARAISVGQRLIGCRVWLKIFISRAIAYWLVWAVTFDHSARKSAAFSARRLGWRLCFPSSATDDRCKLEK